MASFLTGNKLNAAVEDILENASLQLILISPYIKLHERYISVLKSKIQDPELEIIVVFGKNEEDLSKSLKNEDLKFFTQFPNIELRYEKRLHAKFYANESNALITSMNLYSFSQDNNIEAGVLTKFSLLGNLTGGMLTQLTGGDRFDGEAFEFFGRVIQQADLVYKKLPEFESSMMGLKKKYKGSKVVCDKIDDFFNKSSKPQSRDGYMTTQMAPNNYKTPKSHNGFCIRTGVPIDFNPEKPFSSEAFKSWNRFANPEYPEKFCHFSGEPSNGETCLSRPILKKNWHKAKEIHRF